MKYPTLEMHDAKSILTKRSSNSVGDFDELVLWKGNGPDSCLASVDSLHSDLWTLRELYKPVFSARDPERGEFEREACVVIHRALNGLPEEILQDSSFWTWISVIRMADIIESSFGSPGKLADSRNYGVPSKKENMISRLFLRGDIGYDSQSAEPYRIARVGDQDLWRSHITRQRYASCRAISKAFVRVMTGEVGNASNPKPREVAKDIHKLRANLYLECLTEAEAVDLVLELTTRAE
jgi:hypothetical protein